MNISMLKGKIHRATVVQAELNYVGSITVDPVLMEAAGILEYEKVQIVDVENGSRFENVHDRRRRKLRHDLPQWGSSAHGAGRRPYHFDGIRGYDSGRSKDAQAESRFCG